MTKPVSKKEVLSLFIIFLLMGIIAAHLLIFYSKVRFFWIMNMVISVYFMLITVVSVIFKKPYLTVVFGCHAKTCRSTKFIHSKFNLCSRCFGILLGIVFSPAITWFEFKYVYLLPLILPLIGDGLLQHKTTYQSNRYKRIVTGFLFGIGLVVILMYAYYYQGIIIKKLVDYLSRKI